MLSVVRPCVRPFVTRFDACHILLTVLATLLKFHTWISHGKIAVQYFFFLSELSPFLELYPFEKKNVLQALHDTPPLCFFCCCTCFGIKNINVSTRFDQIHQLFHKVLRINIILNSIKGHNSDEQFEKIMCINHNMDHIYQCINKLHA